MHPLRDQTAVAGVGYTKQGKLPGETPITLATQALKRALDDCGLRKEQIDGLLTMPGTTSPEGTRNYLRFGEAVGINPRYLGSKYMGGGTAGAILHEAAMAVNAGFASYVACVFADTAASGGTRFNEATG